MNRREIRERVEEYLQDVDNKRWGNTELNKYIDDAQREFIRLTRFPHTTTTVALSSSSTTPVAGTATVSGGTVTITTSSPHGLTTGHAVVTYSGSGENTGTYLANVDSTTTFWFLSTKVTAGSMTYLTFNPDIAVPNTIEEVVSIYLDGLELAIMSEGEINSAVFRYNSSGLFMEGVFGTIPNPFTTANAGYTVNATPKWKDRNGPVEAVIANNVSARSYRVFPLPAHDNELFVDKDATPKKFKYFEIRGIPRVTDITLDTDSPTINHFYHEALIYGALERAYTREGQNRNVEKGQIYRSKFAELVNEARLYEPMTSITRSEGRNEAYFRVVR